MKRSYVYGAAAILLVLTAGCASLDYYGTVSGGLRANELVLDKVSAQDQSQPSGELRATEKEANRPPADGADSGERKKVYTAHNELEVADVEKTKDLIREYVLGAGGFVDAVGDSNISVRVPKVRFDETVRWTLTLGRVLRNEIQNYDVTEFYSDMDSRLKLATETRKRLNQLLAGTTDVEERVLILREIRRLTEQIESLEQTLKAIGDAVAFSRIDIGLVPLLTDDGGQKQIPFAWIANLSPAYRTVSGIGASLSLTLGPEFAIIEKNKPFYAESSRGVQVRIGSVENKPKGNKEFWQKALSRHLTPLYAKTENVVYGTTLAGLRLTSFDLDPYVYEVLIEVNGDTLTVMEVYFPTLEHFTKTGASIDESLRKAVGGSGT